MESTKVVSFRIPMKEYEDLILECEAKGITITEWYERQIAANNKVKSIKSELLNRMEKVYDLDLNFPEFAQRRLRRVIKFIEREL